VHPFCALPTRRKGVDKALIDFDVEYDKKSDDSQIRLRLRVAVPGFII
jgi:hypothetical protein